MCYWALECGKSKLRCAVTIKHTLNCGVVLFACYLFILFLPHGVACRILISQSETKPMLPAVKAWSLNYWTSREAPVHCILDTQCKTHDVKQLCPRKKYSIANLRNKQKILFKPIWGLQPRKTVSQKALRTVPPIRAQRSIRGQSTVI